VCVKCEGDGDNVENLEGRLSADTSEQIFISQQIETMMAALEQQQPGETITVDEPLLLDLDTPQHEELPADSLEQPPPDVDQLQSPYREPTGNNIIIITSSL